MQLQLTWDEFLKTEFDVFSLTIPDIGIYIVIAILCRLLMPKAGLVALRSNYLSKVGQFSLSDNSLYNIIYRIVAPAFLAYFFLTILAIISTIFKLGWLPEIRWMPVLIYWIIYINIVASKNIELYPIWTLLIQGFTSLVTTVYFDWAVVCQLPNNGLFAFDQSNIGWQVLVAAFLAAGTIVLSGITRRVKSYNGNLAKRRCLSNFNPYVMPIIDETTETKLFDYVREYDALLPKRFHEDKLLKVFFYSIMLIEDSNRPKWIRALERLLFFTGHVKSTGIMQIKSDVRLSDKDSVKKSFQIILAIWDSHLKSVSKYKPRHSDPIITFTADWYQYTYGALLRKSLDASNMLYGEYCGTNAHDIRETFISVEAFIRLTENSNIYSHIYVKSNLFQEEARWFPRTELFSQGKQIQPVDSVTSIDEEIYRFSYYGQLADEQLDADIAVIKKHLQIRSIEYIEDIRCVVIAVADEEKGINILLQTNLHEWSIEQLTKAQKESLLSESPKR